MKTYQAHWLSVRNKATITLHCAYYFAHVIITTWNYYSRCMRSAKLPSFGSIKFLRMPLTPARWYVSIRIRLMLQSHFWILNLDSWHHLTLESCFTQHWVCDISILELTNDTLDSNWLQNHNSTDLNFDTPTLESVWNPSTVAWLQRHATVEVILESRLNWRMVPWLMSYFQTLILDFVQTLQSKFIDLISILKLRSWDFTDRGFSFHDSKISLSTPESFSDFSF